MQIVRCAVCGKQLLIRKDNGLWVFNFGTFGPDKKSVVEMEIHGSIKMTCLRKSCRHNNVFDFFPNNS